MKHESGSSPMVDFEKLLTESLARTHEKYVEAMRDLLREHAGQAS